MDGWEVYIIIFGSRCGCFWEKKNGKKKIGHRLPRGVPTWCMHGACTWTCWLVHTCHPPSAHMSTPDPHCETQHTHKCTHEHPPCGACIVHAHAHVDWCTHAIRPVHAHDDWCTHAIRPVHTWAPRIHIVKLNPPTSAHISTPHAVHASFVHMPSAKCTHMVIGAHMPSTKCTHEHPGSTLWNSIHPQVHTWAPHVRADGVHLASGTNIEKYQWHHTWAPHVVHPHCYFSCQPPSACTWWTICCRMIQKKCVIVICSFEMNTSNEPILNETKEYSTIKTVPSKSL